MQMRVSLPEEKPTGEEGENHTGTLYASYRVTPFPKHRKEAAELWAWAAVHPRSQVGGSCHQNASCGCCKALRSCIKLQSG